MKTYEVEQKYKIKNPAAFRKKIRALKARKISSGYEENAIFDLNKLGVKGILRLRKKGDQGVLTFKGPRMDGIFKKRLEVETQVDYKKMDEILKCLRLKPSCRYSKTREEYKVGKVHITLDYLKNKGWFSEIEGSHREIQRMQQKLGFTKEDREERTYLEILGIYRS